MLGYFIFIIVLLPKCSCVGIEYIDDKVLSEEQIEDYEENVFDLRRMENENVTENNKTHYLKFDKKSEHNFKEDDLYKYITTSNKNKMTTRINVSTTDKYEISITSRMTIFPSDTFKEYEYMYDDNSKPHLLRQKLPKVIQEIQENISESNMKAPLTEFYNLEPAIQYLNLNAQNIYSDCYSIWYTLEDLPCWNLPLLYGEFGKQKKTSDVFLIHKGKLKNVIEKSNDDNWQNEGTVSIPLTYYTNKWCKYEPCYGDHTLCLFSDKYMSGLCDEGYIVEVPNISEQTALINTLNSMRNKIANGKSDRYSHLPPAANMKQIIYDRDLENFAKVWLHQCLPGPEPCSALDETFVTQLECTKFAKYCCVKSFNSQYKKCTPKPECFTSPVVGCLYVWFWEAGDNLTSTDIECGHTSIFTYNTAQLFWANTYKIGCAYGKKRNGDIRVICNFSPGAPFRLDARFYCGILNLKGGIEVPREKNISDKHFLKAFGINMNQLVRNETERKKINDSNDSNLKFDEDTDFVWGIDTLHEIYTEGWIRKELHDYRNGTRNMVARLVVKYKFQELNGARCDSDEPIYITGAPGSLCVERGRRYSGLCYDFRDPTPGYRLVAVIAPIALFSLILYDLFSGVVRQTNY